LFIIFNKNKIDLSEKILRFAFILGFSLIIRYDYFKGKKIQWDSTINCIMVQVHLRTIISRKSAEFFPNKASKLIKCEQKKLNYLILKHLKDT